MLRGFFLLAEILSVDKILLGNAKELNQGEVLYLMALNNRLD